MHSHDNTRIKVEICMLIEIIILTVDESETTLKEEEYFNIIKGV